MDFPQGGFLGKSAALLRRIGKMNIPTYAAGAGFFMVLSVFPMLVLLLSILRYTQLDARDLLELASGYVPKALHELVERLVIQTYAHSGAAVVSLSALGALWSSGRGIYGILRGLNAVYEVRESRSWFARRAISAFYTLAFLVLLLLGLGLNVFGSSLLEWLPRNGQLWHLLEGVLGLRKIVMLLLQTLLFAAIFVALPNCPNRFRDGLPGAAVASLGWQIFSDLFSLYVEHWAGYSNLYGSVYALALAMLWLYCCLCILFFGAALNHLRQERK